ncbi:MAG: hypothetical protein KGQ51_13255 [Planctomycetes bacterium]|jgi:hypothetical protein|nr:hypothetical protein [Planctomycetota bacterium]
MGRSFAACLGCIAMLTQIASGFLHGTDTETTLVRCVVALVIAAIPGWIIGQMADAVVRESIEAQYRRQIEQFKSQQTGKTGTA